MSHKLRDMGESCRVVRGLIENSCDRQNLGLLAVFKDFISEACDSDDGDPDVEFEAWKFRELQRLKRDREAREAEEAEQVTFH